MKNIKEVFSSKTFQIASKTKIIQIIQIAINNTNAQNFKNNTKALIFFFK
jgi:hypothetical protein